MRGLRHPARRRFGQGLGAALALAGLPRALRAHDGAHEITVRIAGFAFDPPEVDILAGDSVVWINGDLAPHSAAADDGRWATGPLERNGRARLTFDTPGSHSYVCQLHPQMRGNIVVRAKADG